MAGAGGGRAFLSALANLHGNQDEERQRKERQRNELTANLDEQIREKQQRKAAEKHRLEALAAAEAAEQKQPQVRRFEELSEPQKEAVLAKQKKAAALRGLLGSDPRVAPPPHPPALAPDGAFAAPARADDGEVAQLLRQLLQEQREMRSMLKKEGEAREAFLDRFENFVERLLIGRVMPRQPQPPRELQYPREPAQARAGGLAGPRKPKGPTFGKERESRLPALPKIREQQRAQRAVPEMPHSNVAHTEGELPGRSAFIRIE